MTDYKAIKGKNIQHLASDLDNAEGEGQIWFNTATSDYKTITSVTGAWASGGALNTSRYMNIGFGTQTAGLTAQGSTNPGATDSTINAEAYDGSSWTEGANPNTARAMGTGFGTQTAALMASGSPDAFSMSTPYGLAESWDGSSWTEVNDPSAAGVVDKGSFGTQTAGITFGGQPGTPLVETFDGTNWARASDLNTDRYGCLGFGLQTAGICHGGHASNPGFPSQAKMTEEYDGSSWTEVADSNTLRRYHGSAGTFSAGLIYGGNITQPPTNYGPGTANTETWNGVAWTEVANLSAGRTFGGSTGTQRAAFYAGGSADTPNAGQTTTEEWDQSSTLAAGAWAAGGQLSTARSAGMSTDGKDSEAVLFAAGDGGPPSTYPVAVESYDGTSWTEIADMNQGRNRGAGAGTTTATLGYGGYSPANVPPASGSGGAAVYHVKTEVFDGSSWTEVADLNAGRYSMSGIGTSTAALGAGGYQGAYKDISEEYNGTSWAEGDNLNTARRIGSGWGTQTAGAVAGGQKAPSDTASADQEQYDGSSWTEVANLNTARSYAASGGTQTSALADLSTGRNTPGGDGNTTTALVMGGSIPAKTNTSEEWALAQNVKIITD